MSDDHEQVATVIPVPAADRTEFINRIARQRAVIDKAELICDICRGRRVLDVGCINHSAEVALDQGERWLHHRIKRVAGSATGLDLLAEDAAALNARGYEIIVGDAQAFDLNRTFDVVVAADLIEHITNAAGFLKSALSHMDEQSILVLTTPNPFDFSQMMQVLVRGRAVVNAEHTMWLDPGVMFETLQREGLRVTRFEWIESDPEYRPETWPTKLLERTSAAVRRFRPLVRANYAVVAQRAR